MPLYEYHCNSCHHRVTILVRDPQEATIVCPGCGGTSLDRLFSRFSVRKSWGAIYEDILSDSQLVQGLERDDPRALAEWNKRMSHGDNAEITPEYQEMLGRMEAGEMPDKLIEEQKIKQEE